MKCKEGFLSSGHHYRYFLLLACTITGRRGEAVNESSRNYNTSDNNNACHIYFAVGVSESQPESLDVLPEVEKNSLAPHIIKQSVFSVSYELRQKKQFSFGHRNNITQPEGSTPIDEAKA